MILAEKLDKKENEDSYGAFNPMYTVGHVLKVSIRKFNLAKTDGELTD